MKRLSLVCIVFAFFVSSAFADKSKLTEEEVQIRTDEISKTLRCVVCMNQSIYDSNAPLATDMRKLVEERVRAGDTNDEVRDYLRGPYGDFVLLRPPFQASTLVLWLGPIIAAIITLVWYIRRKNNTRRSVSHEYLSSEDQRRLAEFLNRESDASGK